jgi:hypothetical protein
MIIVKSCSSSISSMAEHFKQQMCRTVRRAYDMASLFHYVSTHVMRLIGTDINKQLAWDIIEHSKSFSH